jgi:tetratricopeptide (TPR) repeat protein
VRTP